MIRCTNYQKTLPIRISFLHFRSFYTGHHISVRTRFDISAAIKLKKSFRFYPHPTHNNKRYFAFICSNRKLVEGILYNFAWLSILTLQVLLKIVLRCWHLLRMHMQWDQRCLSWQFFAGAKDIFQISPNLPEKPICDKRSPWKFSIAVGVFYVLLPCCHKLENRNFGTCNLVPNPIDKSSGGCARTLSELAGSVILSICLIVMSVGRTRGQECVDLPWVLKFGNFLMTF